MKIKALSLWQPWASLIAVGAKTYETRSWKADYRGPLLICASKRGQRPGFNRLEIMDLLLNHPEFFKSLMVRYGDPGEGHRQLDLWARSIYDDLPFGKAVAVADLANCFPTQGYGWTKGLSLEDIQREQAFGDFSPGRFAWKLEDVRTIEPFPVKGRQGLFEMEVPDHLLRAT